MAVYKEEVAVKSDDDFGTFDEPVVQQKEVTDGDDFSDFGDFDDATKPTETKAIP